MSPLHAEVTIGLPVYNGGRYLETALSSILNQDFPGFEVLICDNGSTDSTPEICARFAGDPRVRYLRFETNAGAAENFNRTFELSSKEFFCWAASDDLMRPRFLRSSMKALEADPGAGMCVTSVAFVDDQGRLCGGYREGAGLSSPNLSRRLRSFLHRPGWYMIYNVARRSVLENTALFRRVYGGDVVLLWELVLQHRLCVIDEVLLDYRVTPKTVEGLAAVVSPEAASRFYRFGHFRMWQQMWRVAGGPSLRTRERRVARRALAGWLLSRSWRALMFRDLYGELRFAVRRQKVAWMPLILAAMFTVRPFHFLAKLLEGSREIARLRNA
jgi:glycosyltransferase involved in cell wall biosynthesis